MHVSNAKTGERKPAATFLCGDVWPFASADSANVAVNFKGSPSRGIPPVCPARMADNIDKRQCPVKWTVRPTQADLFAENGVAP